MTTLQVRLSARAISALSQYTAQTGLATDAAVDELILRSTPELGIQPEQRVNVPDSLPDKKREFLKYLQEYDSVSIACELAGISQGLPYGWARNNVEFAHVFEAVKAQNREARRLDTIV